MRANPLRKPENAPLPDLVDLATIRARLVPLGARTLRRMVSAGNFPRADVSIGGKIRLWRSATVREWIDQQAQEVARQ